MRGGHSQPIASAASFATAARADAIDRATRQWVQERRAMGASWGAVAKMLGLSEDSVRRACDATYAGQHGASPLSAQTTAPRVPHEQSRRVLFAWFRGGVMLPTLRLLAAAPRTVRQIADARGVTPRAVDLILNRLIERDLAQVAPGVMRPRPWMLTPAGHTALADLERLAEGTAS